MLQGIKSVQEFLRQNDKPIIGLGNTAFLRTGLIPLVPNYRIVCIQESADTSAIRKVCPVLSVEKDFGSQKPKKYNTSSLLAVEGVKAYLQSQARNAAFFLYKSTPQIEKAIATLGGRLLINRSQISVPFEDKKEFRKLGLQAGLPILPGETLLIDDLTGERFAVLQKKYGQRLVFQLTDYKMGGGIGTVFVNNLGGLQDLLAFVARRRQGGKNLQWVNVTPFVEGISASIIGMITRTGILAGPLQMQLTDVPEVTAFHGRSGVWCGHDWLPGRFSPRQQKEAESIVGILGTFMVKKGYRGIFGMDVVVDQKQDKVYSIECNARYTGAFPVYSMLQLQAGEPSFDLFQVAEFLDLDYSFAMDQVQGQWRKSLVGSQLVLHNQTRKWVKIGGAVKPGVYQALKWLRPGFAMQDIADPANEFVYTDGVPEQGCILKPGERLGRLLFRKSIAQKHNRINDWTQMIVKRIYEGLKIQTIARQ